MNTSNNESQKAPASTSPQSSPRGWGTPIFLQSLPKPLPGETDREWANRAVAELNAALNRRYAQEIEEINQELIRRGEPPV